MGFGWGSINPFSGDNDAENAAERVRWDEQARMQRIKEGTKQIDDLFASRFTPDFFERLRQASLGVAVPDINTQFQDARRQLVSALARGGIGRSSEAARRTGRLNSERERAYGMADDVAEQQVKQTRADIENQRAALYAQLQATADPGAVAGQANARAEYLSVPPMMETVGPVFQNITAGLAGALTPRYDAYGRSVSSGRSAGASPGASRSRIVRGG